MEKFPKSHDRYLHPDVAEVEKILSSDELGRVNEQNLLSQEISYSYSMRRTEKPLTIDIKDSNIFDTSFTDYEGALYTNIKKIELKLLNKPSADQVVTQPSLSGYIVIGGGVLDKDMNVTIDTVDDQLHALVSLDSKPLSVATITQNDIADLLSANEQVATRQSDTNDFNAIRDTLINAGENIGSTTETTRSAAQSANSFFLSRRYIRYSPDGKKEHKSVLLRACQVDDTGQTKDSGYEVCFISDKSFDRYDRVTTQNLQGMNAVVERTPEYLKTIADNTLLYKPPEGSSYISCEDKPHVFKGMCREFARTYYAMFPQS